jgi:hypothetical protein
MSGSNFRQQAVLSLLLLFLYSCQPQECKEGEEGPDQAACVPPVEPTPSPTVTATPTPTSKPTPTPTTTSSPPPVGGGPINFDERELVKENALLVSKHLNTSDKLLLKRSSDQRATVEACQDDYDSFGENILKYVKAHLAPKKLALQTISSYYQLPAKNEEMLAVGLFTHSLCTVDEESLAASITSGKVPDEATIDLMNEFGALHNQNIELSKSGKLEEASYGQLKLWSKLSYCLSYVESLTTADTDKSKEVASRYAPSGYVKPAGVKFYEDPLQSEASRLNIGLYQFTPNASGNIHTCINDWNERFPVCKVTDKSSANMIRMMGSSYQGFNAFCGVNKILTSFAVQVNTSSSGRSHQDNLSGGKLRAPASRCVSPFFKSSYTYNHFGPLQNSTGSNLKKLMSCVMSD